MLHTLGVPAHNFTSSSTAWNTICKRNFEDFPSAIASNTFHLATLLWTNTANLIAWVNATRPTQASLLVEQSLLRACRVALETHDRYLRLGNSCALWSMLPLISFYDLLAPLHPRFLHAWPSGWLRSLFLPPLRSTRSYTEACLSFKTYITMLCCHRSHLRIYHPHHDPICNLALIPLVRIYTVTSLQKSRLKDEYLSIRFIDQHLHPRGMTTMLLPMY